MPGDVRAMVDVHVAAFPGFFLTLLGPRFLHRLYRALVRDSTCVCLVAAGLSGLTGLIVGPLEPRGFFRRLIFREGLGFAFDALPALIRQPSLVVPRLVSAVSYRGETPLRYPRTALVSSIAVRPDAAGTGVAAALLEAFCIEAAARGAQHVCLTTDRDSNTAANRFYVKHQFVLESNIKRSGGRVMNRYLRSLVQSEARSNSVSVVTCPVIFGPTDS